MQLLETEVRAAHLDFEDPSDPKGKRENQGPQGNLDLQVLAHR